VVSVTWRGVQHGRLEPRTTEWIYVLYRRLRRAVDRRREVSNPDESAKRAETGGDGRRRAKRRKTKRQLLSPRAKRAR